MNALRRKTLRGTIEELESIQTAIEEAKAALDGVAEEEQDAFDNMPEGPQNGDRSQQMQEYIETMETASSDLEDIDIGSIIEALEEIGG